MLHLGSDAAFAYLATCLATCLATYLATCLLTCLLLMPLQPKLPGHDEYAANFGTSGASCKAHKNCVTPQLLELLTGNIPVAVYMSMHIHRDAA